MTAYLISLALAGLVASSSPKDCHERRSHRFVPRPGRDYEPTDFPTIAFSSLRIRDDPATDHADTAPSEYASPENDVPE